MLDKVFFSILSRLSYFKIISRFSNIKRGIPQIDKWKKRTEKIAPFQWFMKTSFMHTFAKLLERPLLINSSISEIRASFTLKEGKRRTEKIPNHPVSTSLIKICKNPMIFTISCFCAENYSVSRLLFVSWCYPIESKILQLNKENTKSTLEKRFLFHLSYHLITKNCHNFWRKIGKCTTTFENSTFNFLSNFLLIRQYSFGSLHVLLRFPDASFSINNVKKRFKSTSS